MGSADWMYSMGLLWLPCRTVPKARGGGGQRVSRGRLAQTEAPAHMARLRRRRAAVEQHT